MRNLCGNKQNCDQLVNSDIFPEACVGQTKILRVWYQCVGDGKFIFIFVSNLNFFKQLSNL